MGYQHNGGAFFIQLFQLLHHILGRTPVQGSGRFVCKEDLGLVHQAPADTCPLELPAGNLCNVMLRNIADAKLLHQANAVPVDFLPCTPALPCLVGRKQDIVHNGKVFQHMHLLENKPHAGKPHICQFFFC